MLYFSSRGVTYESAPHQISQRNHNTHKTQRQLASFTGYFKLFRVTCDNKCHIWKKHKCNLITSTSKLDAYPPEIYAVLLCLVRYIRRMIYDINCVVSNYRSPWRKFVISVGLFQESSVGWFGYIFFSFFNRRVGKTTAIREQSRLSYRLRPFTGKVYEVGPI